jgi:general secretion pathway protein M
MKLDKFIGKLKLERLLGRLPVDRMMTQFKSMSTRERYAVGFAAVFVFVFFVDQLMISPFLDSKEKKRKLFREKAAQVQEMRSMQADYMAMTAKSESFRRMAAGKAEGFTLFSFLEQIAGQTGIKESISYMKPSKTVQKDTNVTLSLVEIKFQNIDMKKLMDFLYQVETSPNAVYVSGISLTKTGKDQNLLTAILQIETVESEG